MKKFHLKTKIDPWAFPVIFMMFFVFINVWGKTSNASSSPNLIQQPADSAAVFFTPDSFNTHPNDTVSDAQALQNAINQIKRNHTYGIVFIPEGTYILDHTVYLWRGIRLIGYGSERPVFQLPPNTKAFQGPEPAYMIQFCDSFSHRGETIQDAFNTTFYSGISHINFQIQQNNPFAIAVRFRAAQHSSLEHIRFTINDAKAAVHHIGNEIEHCDFRGGDYGIMTKRTSAGWPVLLLNNNFNNQRKACIRTKEAGLTALYCSFRNAPRVIQIPPHQYEHLYMEQCVMENINKTAIEASHTIIPQHSPMFNPGLQEDDDHLQFLNLKSIECKQVPTILRFRDTNQALTTQETNYTISTMTHGNYVSAEGSSQKDTTLVNIQKRTTVPRPINAPFPEIPPNTQWTNIKKQGAKGNGIKDDTKIIQQAINNYKNIYFPQGTYRITEPITLKKHTRLIGLQPIKTVLSLDSGLAEFDDTLNPRSFIKVPKNGQCIIKGIAIDASINPGAIALEWKGSKQSMVDDVLFCIDEKPYLAKGAYQKNSLWIHNGGGYFKNFWSHETIAQRGLKISNTSTPGKIYQASVEHHKKLEVELDHVQNWNFYGLQTEEHLGSEKAHALDIHGCNNLLFANLYMYRVMAMQAGHPYAIKATHNKNIRFRGIHNFSWGENYFTNTLYQPLQNRNIPFHEIGYLKLP